MSAKHERASARVEQRQNRPWGDHREQPQDDRQTGTRWYRLPVQALATLLSTTPAPQRAQARLAYAPDICLWPCLAHVTLAWGTLQTCTITDLYNELLSTGQEAYQALLRCGELEWQINQIESPPAPSSFAPVPATQPRAAQDANRADQRRDAFPRAREDFTGKNDELATTPLPSLPGVLLTPARLPRLRVTPLPAATLAALPHASRMALLLVDGRRSIEEIARLLSRSPLDIYQRFLLLRELVQIETRPISR